MQTTNTPMSTAMRIVFWFVAVNALAGALSLLLFPTRTDVLFFWEIKPALSAALFGALYLGGAFVVAWVTARGDWEPARFLIPVLVTAGVLISITTLLHLERFVSWFRLLYWLVIYIGAPLLAVFFYIDHERKGANWTVTYPVTAITRLVAVVFGSVLFVLGVVLVIWPEGALAYWPWPMKPLMLRIFASWFAAFGAGLLWFLIEREWSRLWHVANLMIVAAGLDLLMLLIHRSDLTTGLSVWIYSAHLALFGVVGLLMHWLQRNLKRQPVMANSG